MRIGKFRAKSLFKNEWWFGYYVYSKTEDKHYIVQDAISDSKGFLSFAHFAEVDPKTLNKFTGVNDKNGNPIYGGDIISDMWKVQVYQNEDGTFMVRFHTNPNANKPLMLKEYLEKREKAGTSICEGYRDCIVVGNIYENPELC